MHTRTELGHIGEHRVAQQLEQEGFTIVARNYTITSGEVDIIARNKNLVVFVEVKTRTTPTYFDLSTVVSYSKQKKIIIAARHWIACHPCNNSSYRFDVALIEHEQVTYIPDAFHARDI